MASLPFTATHDGTITLVLPSLTAVGRVRIIHPDGTSNWPADWPQFSGQTLVVSVKTGDLVVQRINLNGSACFTMMAITAQT